MTSHVWIDLRFFLTSCLNQTYKNLHYELQKEKKKKKKKKKRAKNSNDASLN